MKATTTTDETTPLMRISDATLSIENDRLRAIAEESVANYAQLLADSANDILDALALATEEEDEETGKMPAVRVSHSLAIDLNSDGIKDVVTVSLRHKRDAVSRFPDPQQPTLPGLKR